MRPAEHRLRGLLQPLLRHEPPERRAPPRPLQHPTDREVPAISAFNYYVASVEELHAIIVSLGDGLWVGVTR